MSTSTAESEIKAVNQCLKEEALAMRGMLILMGFPQDATIIEEDNQACMYRSEIPHSTRRMKHLDLAEMLVKEKVESNEIKLLKMAQQLLRITSVNYNHNSIYKEYLVLLSARVKALTYDSKGQRILLVV